MTSALSFENFGWDHRELQGTGPGSNFRYSTGPGVTLQGSRQLSKLVFQDGFRGRIPVWKLMETSGNRFKGTFLGKLQVTPRTTSMLQSMGIKGDVQRWFWGISGNAFKEAPGSTTGLT